MDKISTIMDFVSTIVEKYDLFSTIMDFLFIIEENANHNYENANHNYG